MTVPPELIPLIDNVRKSIENHPQHEFEISHRCTFIEQWLALPVDDTAKAYGCLSILSAIRVLPIYEAHQMSGWTDNWYCKEMPRRLIEMAKATIADDIPTDVTSNIASSMHYVTGNVSEELPWKVALALYAAQKALTDSTGSPLIFFSNLHHLSIVGTFTIPDDESMPVVKHGSGKQGRNFTDLEWASSGQSDAMAAAACSWAYDEQTRKVDTTKLLGFWRWWLDDGITNAWSMVNGA